MSTSIGPALFVTDLPEKKMRTLTFDQFPSTTVIIGEWIDAGRPNRFVLKYCDESAEFVQNTSKRWYGYAEFDATQVLNALVEESK